MGILKSRLARSAAAVLAAALLTAGSAAAARAQELVPLGRVVGIAMETEGVLVSGLSPLETAEGLLSPAGEAGVKPGDVIVRLGAREIRGGGDLLEALEELSGERISLTVRRGERTIQYTVTPRTDGEGVWRLGLWLRDRVSGIGTVTYYDPESGAYGALGHGINDADSGARMPLGSGWVLRAEVTDVTAGQSGQPGELHGHFLPEDRCGDILGNTVSGIFGRMEPPEALPEPVPVAGESEIRLGSAVIRSNISGRAVEDYTVEITRLIRSGGDGRCLMLTVTDPRLLEQTGGIVQGMSGSPILQDGRLVGAVTHVLVDDPTRGYGISAERMLAAGEAVLQSEQAA